MRVGITARNWGWRYATRRHWAVRGVDLEIGPGERVLLLGASGSGKSTLLAGLAGLLDAGEDPRGRSADGSGEQEGALLLDGVPARRARFEAVGAGVARTGLLLQDPQAQTVLARCGDDVAFGLENHAVPAGEIWPRVDAALRGVAFPYGRSHLTSRLSGGERQRLALAGVLALRPGLLLLDEPTAMLDPEGAALLRQQVAAVLDATRATCVLVEHQVAPWLDLIDRVIVLGSEGGVLADGPAGRTLTEQGDWLAEQGVWIPERRSLRRCSGPRAGGELLLRARGMAVARPGPGTAIHRAARPSPGAPVAVRDVDLGVWAGRACCLVGPNGAGKSTLALALAGLVAPVSGELVATGELAAGAGPHPHRWRARYLVTRIGTVFQEPQHQFVGATVAGELAVGPRRAGLPEAEVGRRVGELLERLRLSDLARANPFTLSGGQQRRLAVATALATRPRVLVLDEPTFGQDLRTWTELVDLLIELMDDGVAVVAATHDRELVEALAARVLPLRDGVLVGSALVDEQPR